MIGGVWLVGVCVAAVLPWVASTYWLRLANNMGIMVILTLGLDLIWGRAGQLSFAQPAFFCIGAYASALLSVNAGLNVFLSIALASLVSVAMAFVVGWPSLRLKTHYFALASFGVAEIVRLVAMNWKSVTRGMDGITQIPAPAIAGQTLSTESHFYYLLLGIITILAVGYRRLLGSTYGRALTAVREGELAANVLGINIARLKVLAFALSALFAGMAGGLYAHLFSVISPDVFSFEGVSVPILLSLFIGGSGAFTGVLVGSGVVVLLPEILRVFGQWYLAVYGLGILMLMVFMPEGVAGRMRRVWQERRIHHSAAGTKTLGRHAADGSPHLAHHGGHGEGLRVEHLTKRFGGLLAVNDVSLIIQPGDIKSIIGPNGAGKTTLLNLVTGVYRPDAGSVYFDGQSLLENPIHGIARRGILRTFQNARVWRDLSVLDNVMVSLHGDHRVSLFGVLRGSRRVARIEDEMRERAEEALDFVGLGASAASPAASLPYGHLRLLEVARCLVARPKLILLDEPAAGLNAQEVAFLQDRLQAVRRLGTAVLIIEHNMVFVMSISDQVIVISNGRKIAEASPGEIQRDPAVIEAYLGEDVDLAAR